MNPAKAFVFANKEEVLMDVSNLDITLDYGPLSVGDITDKSGNAATIDGPAKFVVDNADVGEVRVASGDPRFSDGDLVLYTGTKIGTAGNLQCHVDPNLNPDITDDAVIATAPVVLTGVAGPASVGTINLGTGKPKA